MSKPKDEVAETKPAPYQIEVLMRTYSHGDDTATLQQVIAMIPSSAGGADDEVIICDNKALPYVDVYASKPAAAKQLLKRCVDGVDWARVRFESKDGAAPEFISAQIHMNRKAYRGAHAVFRSSMERRARPGAFGREVATEPEFDEDVDDELDELAESEE